MDEKIILHDYDAAIEASIDARMQFTIALEKRGFLVRPDIKRKWWPLSFAEETSPIVRPQL